MKIGKWLMIAALVGMSACSQESTPPPAQSAVPQAAGHAADAAAGAVSFTVQPDSFRICETDNGAVAATVRWSVENGRPSGVAIYVVDGEGNRKLWLKGGASGESTTDAWVFPGTRFVLLEEGSDRQLADASVRGIACE